MWDRVIHGVLSLLWLTVAAAWAVGAAVEYEADGPVSLFFVLAVVNTGLALANVALWALLARRRE